MSDKDVQAVTVRMPKPIHEALKVYTFHAGMSINEFILSAIRDRLDKEGRSKEFSKALDSVRSQYRVALDKLKDL